MSNILNLLGGTKSRIKRLQKIILVGVLQYFIDGLKITDNKIAYTAANIAMVASLDKLKDRFSPAVGRIVDYILGGISDQIDDQIDDISRFDPRAIKMGDPLKKKLLKHASTTANQKADLSTIFQEIKNRSINMLSRPDGASLSELRRTLESLIDEHDLVQRYYARWTHDIYSQYQRVAGDMLRRELGLRFAVYTGGLIETSRPFCEEKNGKVFHESEIAEWQNQEFKGKPDVGYNPIYDVGGYNCRHVLRWISDELAYQLRPEARELFPPIPITTNRAA